MTGEPDVKTLAELETISSSGQAGYDAEVMGGSLGAVQRAAQHILTRQMRAKG